VTLPRNILTAETVAFAVVRIVSAGLLLWASAKHPIGYYTIVRFTVCGTCAFGAYYASRPEKTGWTWAMMVMAVLFNPAIPIYLGKQRWEGIDIVAALVLLASIPLLRPAKEL
jgi:uncharacterized membrane protein